MYCEAFKKLKEFVSLHPDLLETLTEKDLHTLSNSDSCEPDRRACIAESREWYNFKSTELKKKAAANPPCPPLHGYPKAIKPERG